ncbi:MAG: class I SAM-dependent methyltransferase [Clostridiales bacterium]|nr:class I SAM-dependent methyltransferase [Clostridiales bacterium]
MNHLVAQWYEEKENVDEMHNWNPGLKEWEQSVAGFFPSHASVLDIGCGLGREAFALSDLGHAVVGIDISKEVILQVKQISSEKGYHIPFYEYNGELLDFPAEAFDVVVIWAQTFGLLYGNKYKKDYLAECKRVLKKGGLLSFSTHDYHYLKEKYPNCLCGRKFYPYFNAEIYWETFEATDLMRFANQAGMDVVLCEKGNIYRPEDGTILHCLCKK